MKNYKASVSFFIYFLLIFVLFLPTSRAVQQHKNMPDFTTIDFSQPTSDFSRHAPWEQKNEALYFNGATKAKYYLNHFHRKIKADFSVAVTTKWEGGAQNNSYGIIFRLRDSSNYYTFEISANGYFRLNQKINNHWNDTIHWKFTNYILLQGENRLKVVCLNEKIQCFINDQLVIQTIDSLPTKPNLVAIGFAASGDVACSFDNFAFRELTSHEENYLTTKSISFVEDFSGKTTVFGSNHPWRWQDGHLTFDSDAETVFFTNVPYDEFTHDITVTAQTKWLSGADDNGYGLIYRYQDNQNYYSFEIARSGYYRVSKKQDNKWFDLIKWQATSYINSDTNLLKVVCIKEEIRCYINNHLVANISDNYAATGYICNGICINGDVKCSFDDYQVQEISLQDAPLVINNLHKPEEKTTTEITAPVSRLISFNKADNNFHKAEYYEVNKQRELVFTGGKAGSFYKDLYKELIPVNSTVAVKTRWDNGADDKGFGLIFRYKNIDNFYLFIISGNGYYKLCRSVPEPEAWKTLQEWTNTALIHTGYNHLKVVCHQENIKCYLNGTLVIDLNEALPKDQKLYAGVGANSLIKCRFDDFQVTY